MPVGVRIGASPPQVFCGGCDGPLHQAMESAPTTDYIRQHSCCCPHSMLQLHSQADISGSPAVSRHLRISIRHMNWLRDNSRTCCSTRHIHAHTQTGICQLKHYPATILQGLIFMLLYNICYHIFILAL